MEILKDFLSQIQIIWRVIVYAIGLVFWTWFVFMYPVNRKDDSPAKNQSNIGTVEGDYVAGNKNVIYGSKETSSVKKMDRFPEYRTLTIQKDSPVVMHVKNGNRMLYDASFRWIRDEVLVLIKLPEEKEERAYTITNETKLPFTIQINTNHQTCLMTVEKKLTSGLQIRTFSE